MKVFLDPGHGPGKGSMVKLENGSMLVEESLNWQIAVKLDQLLSQDGHIVMLSRAANSAPTLKERARMCVQWGADIALSIHHNASARVYVPNDAPSDVDGIPAEPIAVPDPKREEYAKTEIYIVEPNFWVPDEGHSQLNTPFNRVKVYCTDPVTPRNIWMQGRVANVLYPYTRNGFYDVALLECGYLDVLSHQQIINQPGYVERMAIAVRNWIEARERKQVLA
jgi:hypothetical protein